MGLLEIGSPSTALSKKQSLIQIEEIFSHTHLPSSANVKMVKRTVSKVSCRLRGVPKKPLWRGRVLSSKAMQAVQSLKLARSSNRLDSVFESRISRLMKADLLATLAELQRQNEYELAIMVFGYVRKEEQYKPDLSLYSDMLFLMGKNKLINMAEELFTELKNEGLKPDTRAYTEMVGAFLRVGMVEKSMETYILMKEEGCAPDKLTLAILIRNLEKIGEKELALNVKKDCMEYIDFPEKFLSKVGREYPKRRPFEFV